jgi:hypothetical protein
MSSWADLIKPVQVRAGAPGGRLVLRVTRTAILARASSGVIIR